MLTAIFLTQKSNPQQMPGYQQKQDSDRRKCSRGKREWLVDSTKRHGRRSAYIDGVPGPVRTANLPLRRGMLYPIELLGQMTSASPTRAATDGVHLNGGGRFCHVVLRHFACRANLAHTCIASPSKRRGLQRSCKLHYSKMPSLQTATRSTHTNTANN